MFKGYLYAEAEPAFAEGALNFSVLLRPKEILIINSNVVKYVAGGYMRLLSSIVLLVAIFFFGIFYTDLLNFTGIDPEIDFRVLEYFALQSILFILAGALLSLLFVDVRRFQFRAFSIVAWIGAGILLVCFWMPYVHFLPNVIIFHPEAHTFVMIAVGMLMMAGFFKNRSE